MPDLHIHVHVHLPAPGDPEITDPELVRIVEEIVETSTGLAAVVPNLVSSPQPKNHNETK